MIMQQNIEYLLEKVDDATIWPFILGNKLPLYKVINDTLE